MEASPFVPANADTHLLASAVIAREGGRSSNRQTIITGCPAGACHRAGQRPDPLAGHDKAVFGFESLFEMCACPSAEAGTQALPQKLGSRVRGNERGYFHAKQSRPSWVALATGLALAAMAGVGPVLAQAPPN